MSVCSAVDSHLPGDSQEIQHILSEERIGPRDGAGNMVVVAMSGGVDSAVTALIMRERGYRVVGMNLRLFSPDDEDHRVNPCCGIPAMDDARMTCAMIDVPFYAVNMETEFSEAVVDRFVDDYASGRTPNPCLECNRHVKFRHLVTRARELGADCLATGHYARIVHAPGGSGEPHRLYRASDDQKDQSYVLHTMTQDQIGFLRFPLGNLRKPEVRMLARHFGLPVADKPESQEICFVGRGSYADFVAKRRPEANLPGEIVTSDGTEIGTHRGLLRHTIGQRRGIGIARPEPLYVLELDTEHNRLMVGSRSEAEAHSLEAHQFSWTNDQWPSQPLAAEATVRYRGTPHRVMIETGSADERTARIRFEDGGPVASPGQAVVIYQNDEVLGGGTIARVERDRVDDDLGSHRGDGGVTG